MIAESVKTYQNYIGGQWRNGGGSSELEIKDPATAS